MTEKKSGATKAAAGESEATQRKLNELYTAHQVHTLAQLIYRQIAARGSGGGPWALAVGGGISPSMDGRHVTQGWTGNLPGGPPPLVYWYP